MDFNFDADLCEAEVDGAHGSDAQCGNAAVTVLKVEGLSNMTRLRSCADHAALAREYVAYLGGIVADEWKA